MYGFFKATSLSGASSLKARHTVNALEFRNLSKEFLGAESRRSYVAEAALFTIIVAISAWPIVLMAQAIARWIR
jgi:hypothetical protein